MKKLIFLLLLVPGIASAQKAATCEQIDYEFDKFTNKKTFLTPYEADTKSPTMTTSQMDFIKVITSKVPQPVYFLDLRTVTESTLKDIKGVILLLKNGNKINKPNATIKVQLYGEFKSVRSAFLTLTSSDLEQLKLSPITGFRLYDSDQAVSDPQAYLIWLNCLLTKK
jgi:hypothetical protein